MSPLLDTAPAAAGLPADHPLRTELNHEVHARPSAALAAPLRISYLAFSHEPLTAPRDAECLAELAERFGAAPPEPRANHYAADFGEFQLRWERHSEFSRYMFIVPAVEPARPALASVPRDWVERLPGSLIVAAHLDLVSGDGRNLDYDDLSLHVFSGNALIGSQIAEGAGIAVTDFCIYDDGFSRWLVVDSGMTPRQAGRMVQRLLEIDTYRMMALLALPVARELFPLLVASEESLAQITKAMITASGDDEPVLLVQLTRLEAELNSRISRNHFRFGAAAAYYSLVRRRIQELREERLSGLQTFHEFVERRLAPAMSTCQASAALQESLSVRIARATHLLATRVQITREQQTQKLLESMERRAKLQLRLQETVEGLSVAAITYYVVALLNYLLAGLEIIGAPLNKDLLVAAGIPVIALLVLLGVRKVRRTISASSE